MMYLLESLAALKKPSIYGLLLITFLTSTAQADLFKKEAEEKPKQYPEIPSIHDVYYMARDYDNQVAAARYRANAEKEIRAQARSALLPKANVKAFTRLNDNFIDTDVTFIAPESRYNENGYTLVLSQALFNASALIGLPEAKLKAKKSDLLLLEQEQNLIARVADAYIGLIVAQSNLTVVETQEKAIEELLEQAKLNFDLGTATISDTHEAQAARDVVHAQVIAVSNQLKIIKHELYTLTGHHIDDVVKFKTDLPLDLEGFKIPPLEELEKIALKANLRLNISRIDHALAKIQLRKSQTDRLPKLDMVATFGENNANSSTFGGGASDTEFYTVGAELSMPLLAGGAINSNVRKARFQYNEKQESLENTEKQTLLQLTEAFLNVDLARSSVTAFRKAVQSAKLSLDSTKLGFELGERTSLDVLSAQQTYYQALRDHTESQYNYILASIGINLSLGIISEKDIIFIAELAEQLNSGKAIND